MAFSPKTTKIRTSIKKLINCFFSPKIFSIYVYMFIYITILIWGLYYIGIWEMHQLKNTIIWTISVGTLSIYKINSIKKEPKFIKNLILDNLKLIAVVEFIVSFYAFSFLIEFLLVPIYVLIGGMLAISYNDKKFKILENILNLIIILIGSITIIYSIYMCITCFSEFANLKTIHDFIIPPILSLFYIPFICVLIVLFSYELAFIRIKHFIKNPEVQKYAKVYSIVKFNFRIRILERWVFFMQMHNTASKEDVRNTVKQILKMVSIEKSPPDIPLKDGWSPYIAKDFLISEGLKTSYYQPTLQAEWIASSPMIQTDDSIFSNSISYHIEGDIFATKTLKIILDVFHYESVFLAHSKLYVCAKKLFNSALNIDIPNDIKHAILEGVNNSFQFGIYKVDVQKNTWGDSNNKNYSIEFILTKN